MDWQALFLTLGSTTVLIAALAWLARTIIIQLISKDLEKFKHDLKAQADMQLAGYVADLQLIAAREQTRFNLLHQQRAQAVAEVYALISRTHRAARAFTNLFEMGGEPTKSELFKELAEVGNKLGDYFDAHRIYFPPEVCAQFDEFYFKIRMATQTMMDGLRSQSAGRHHSGLDPWLAASKVIQTEVPPMKTALEDQFRAILGSLPVSMDDHSS